MKINSFRVDLTSFSAKNEALLRTGSTEAWHKRAALREVRLRKAKHASGIVSSECIAVTHDASAGRSGADVS